MIKAVESVKKAYMANSIEILKNTILDFNSKTCFWAFFLRIHIFYRFVTSQSKLQKYKTFKKLFIFSEIWKKLKF